MLLEASNRMKSLTPPTERARPLHAPRTGSKGYIGSGPTFYVDELRKGTLYILVVNQFGMLNLH